MSCACIEFLAANPNNCLTGYDKPSNVDPDVIGLYYAKCNEYINLRKTPSTSADSLAKIAVNKQFTVLAIVDEYFSWIDYNGQRGYVLNDYMEKVK